MVVLVVGLQRLRRACQQINTALMFGIKYLILAPRGFLLRNLFEISKRKVEQVAFLCPPRRFSVQVNSPPKNAFHLCNMPCVMSSHRCFSNHIRFVFGKNVHIRLSMHLGSVENDPSAFLEIISAAAYKR